MEPLLEAGLFALESVDVGPQLLGPPLLFGAGLFRDAPDLGSLLLLAPLDAGARGGELGLLLLDSPAQVLQDLLLVPDPGASVRIDELLQPRALLRLLREPGLELDDPLLPAEHGNLDAAERRRAG